MSDAPPCEAPPQSRSGMAYGTSTGIRPAAAATRVTPRTAPATSPGLSTQAGGRLIDACLWVRLPGESDGCTAAPGAFSPAYAHGPATG
ncbi:hypothetical protein [Streptomyces sp. NPDC058629]|uniref:hypothetical protein n=1 Tax=Streptomyces sp. NPDC058629 TaxID=3346565 RepID=UPI003661AE04